MRLRKSQWISNDFVIIGSLVQNPTNIFHECRHENGYANDMKPLTLTLRSDFNSDFYLLIIPTHTLMLWHIWLMVDEVPKIKIKSMNSTSGSFHIGLFNVDF